MGHALFFVLGFTLVFVILGVAAGSVGQILRGAWFRYAGGVIVILFGLTLMRLLHLPFLEKEARLEWRGDRRWGFLSSLFVGMVFAAGWTPCVGPALTSILILSAERSTASTGALLLAAYSLGLGLPFIVAGVLMDRLSGVLQRMGKHVALFQTLSGMFLVILGVLLITDSLTFLGVWLEQRGIGWDLGI